MWLRELARFDPNSNSKVMDCHIFQQKSLMRKYGDKSMTHIHFQIKKVWYKYETHSMHHIDIHVTRKPQTKRSSNSNNSG